MTDIEWTEKAIDLLNGLEQENQQRIISKLEEAQDWTSHRLDKLSGYPYYKLRAGDYRAIITWDRDQDLLIVEAVGHRRNIYDRHLPP
jgi:mRNA interferase RelE/StbE